MIDSLQRRLMKAIGIYGLIFLAVLMTMRCGMPESEDQKFESFAKGYIEQLLVRNPEWATSLGDHRFDDRMNNYTQAAVQIELKAQRDAKQSLQKIVPAQLSSTNQIDYKILDNNIEFMIFQIETLREYEWDTQYYNIGKAIYSLTS